MTEAMKHAVLGATAAITLALVWGIFWQATHALTTLL